jgi:hypothetical protein
MTMMDTDVLTSFRSDVPPPDPAVLVKARNRLTARPAPRIRWRLAAVGGTVVVVVAGLLVAGYLADSVPVPTSVPDTEAAHLLEHAALAAQQLPAPAAKADRFVFVESVTAYASGMVGPGGKTTWTNPPPKLRQIWLSVDGSRDGLMRERPRDGGADWTTYHLSGASGPAALTDLPTGTDAMVRYLYRNSHGGNPPDQQAFITVGDLVRESYLPPAALSALWSAAARIPGVGTAHDAVDAAGRHGVAVFREFNGLRQELIFDPHTYAFLGEREVVTADQDGLTKGQILGSSASMRVAIVDQVGQLP